MNKKKHLKQPTLKDSFILKPEYKENVRISSYLGKKGYTIPKTIMTEEDIKYIKDDLLVKPVEMKINYIKIDADSKTIKRLRISRQ